MKIFKLDRSSRKGPLEAQGELLDLSFGQEIKSGYRPRVKGTRENMYVCIVFFAVEPTAYIKENGTKNMAYPAQECTVGKMCSCLRRAFSIPMMFPRRTGAEEDLVGNRLGRQILQGRFLRPCAKKKRKKGNKTVKRDTDQRLVL